MNQRASFFNLDKAPSAAWTVFASALAMRLLHLVSMAPTLGHEHRLNDGIYFDALAQALVQGSYDGKTPIVGLSPIYVGFLSGFYQWLGHNLLFPRLGQILLGSLACVGLQQISRNLFGERAGWTAGLLAAFCGVFIYFDAILIKASLMNSVWVLVLWALSLGFQRGGWWQWAIAGAGYAAACMLRMQLFLIAPWILWVLLKNRANLKLRQIFLSILFFVIFAAAVPVLVGQWFNFSVSRTKNVPPAHEIAAPQLGIHFYVGNNPDANGTYKKVDGIRASAVGHVVDAKQLAEKEVGQKLDASGLNRFWLRRGIESICEAPWRWIQLEAKKFFLIWNTYEVANNQNYEYWKRYSFILGLPLVSYGWLAPLALLGWIGLRKDSRPMISLLQGTAFFYIAALMLTLVTADYRLPLHSIWIIFAAFAVERFIQNWQDGKVQVLRRSICLFILFFIFCNYQTYLPKYRYESFLHKRHDTILTAHETKTVLSVGRTEGQLASNGSAVLT